MNNSRVPDWYNPILLNQLIPLPQICPENQIVLPERSTVHSIEKENTFKDLKEIEEKLQKKKLKLERENRDLENSLKPKRPYTKRRKNLEKSFKCDIEGCKKEYSSNIALNSHIRKKHLFADSP